MRPIWRGQFGGANLWLQAPYAKAYILRYSMHATHIIVFISHYSVPYTPKQHGSMDQYTSQKNSKTKTTFVWGSGNSFYTYTKKIDFVIKWSHAIAYSWHVSMDSKFILMMRTVQPSCWRLRLLVALACNLLQHTHLYVQVRQ